MSHLINVDNFNYVTTNLNVFLISKHSNIILFNVICRSREIEALRQDILTMKSRMDRQPKPASLQDLEAVSILIIQPQSISRGGNWFKTKKINYYRLTANVKVFYL